MEKEKTLKQLGEIIIANFSTEQIQCGYKVEPSDTEEIGRQALSWGDINPDGTLN